MLTATILILLLVAGLSRVFHRPRLALGLLAAALALFWLTGGGLAASWLLGPLERPYAPNLRPQWGERNAIVLLGAGSVRPLGPGGPQPSLLAYARICEAVRLHHAAVAEGRHCTLLISGGDPLHLGASEAALYRDVALGLGVPDRDLVLEDRSVSTFQNAEFSAPLLNAGGYDHLVLVTSALHMTRSLSYFRHFGLQAEPAMADQMAPIRSWVPLGYNLAMADFAVHEYAGTLRYQVYERLGLNKQ